ncbi:MAG: Ppx/GppA phosphatase family protein [Solirubrobacteraceae bacterium]
MRVAILDIGSNSTRVYVADVSPLQEITDVYRRSRVTRLADGLERSGRLNPASIDRVLATLDDFTSAIAEHGAEQTLAVLTSAVRDASNGAQLPALIAERYGVNARTLSGEEEARLTFRGAQSGRVPGDQTPTLVIDIGGGSTELIVGAGEAVSFAHSLQAGVVRQSERHLHADPPTTGELHALRAEMRELVESAVPPAVRVAPTRAVAVAGTATSAAAIDQALEPYDPDMVHGRQLELATLKLLLARLAAMPLAERRHTRGLHPDRAAVIVAGLAMLIETLAAFDLDACVVSEHDILRGAALLAASLPASQNPLDR